MKLGLMLGDLIGSLFRSPATVRFPATRLPTPAGLRGPVQWNRLKCTGCGVCVMDCPATALQLVTLDKSSKRFVLDYHLERCTFCSQCVQSCRQGALSLSNSGWELATANSGGLVMHYGEPEDVQRVLADQLASGAGTGHAG
jgi:formate hydrogenlyase subunit 6/NADH:ubiquinone oxidoreductase subunit I